MAMLCICRQFNFCNISGLIALWTLWNSFLCYHQNQLVTTLTTFEDLKKQTVFETFVPYKRLSQKKVENEAFAIQKRKNSRNPVTHRSQDIKRKHQASLVEAKEKPRLLSNNYLKQEQQRKERRKKKSGRIHLPLKIPFPVFIPSLPKSGTTSIWRFFTCAGQRAAHQWVQADIFNERTLTNRSTMLAGDCILNNINLGLPPFNHCGEYDVWSDAGVARDDRCFFPSIHALDEIYQTYPNATILFVVRDADRWTNSISRWEKGKLMRRIKDCQTIGFPLDDHNFREFYDWHSDMIRKFVKDHQSLTYIEVELESDETGEILEDRIGIPSSCWRHCLPNNMCVSDKLVEDHNLPWNF